MLRSLHSMNGFHAAGSDGEVGRLVDAYFDDSHWTVRYLVIDSGGLLAGRQVLVSPYSVDRVGWHEHEVHLRLTQDQVRRSPGVDTAMPVSRLEETNLNRHYGWPDYWSGGSLWGPTDYPDLPSPGGGIPAPSAQPQPPDAPAPLTPADSHLQSANDVKGYDVRASDGKLGRVVDFLIDDANWSIRAIVVDTEPWLPGGEVAVSPDQAEGVAWEQRELVVKQDRASLRHDPTVNLSEIRRQK